MTEWHLITSEYPPQPGGVSDYTRSLATGLAALGNQVHVWCPAFHGSAVSSEGVSVHRDLGRASQTDLARVGEQLDRFPAPRRILVQWVPHGYGYRSMNLGFCYWLWRRSAKHGDAVELMVHEPFLAFREGSRRQDLVALVHRLMITILLRASERVWMSIPDWESRCRPYTFGRSLPFQWLPIPSTIPVRNDAGGVQTVRRRFASSGHLLIGHFGTYGQPVASLLEPILVGMEPSLAGKSILLMGIGSVEFRKKLIDREPRFADSIRATGPLSPEELSTHIAACDVIMQPYPDGVTTRRTSFMAGLSHGKAIVTTTGHLTESLWSKTDAVALAPAGDAPAFAALLQGVCSDPARRARMEAAARKIYSDRFDISHTLAALQPAAAKPALQCAS